MAKVILSIVLALAVMAPSIAYSQFSAAQLCESAVELASAKYAQCRLTAESKYSKSGDAPKRTAALSKCSERLSGAFSKATLRYGALNCTGSPSTSYGSYLTQCTDDVAAAAIAGGMLPSCGNGSIDVVGEQCDDADLGGETCASLGFPGGGVLGCTAGCALDTSGCEPSLCGNGVIDGAEQCDGAALGGATCTSLGYTKGGTLGCTSGCGYDTSACRSQSFLATGQKTCWDTAGSVVPCAGTGQDGDLQRGAALSYVDNGDGTITDVNTGLMWEKLANDGSVHDWDNTYSWTDAWAVKVAALNAAQFAGHSDWRLPNRRELESILSLEVNGITVEPAFHDESCQDGCSVTTCACTCACLYWTSSTSKADPTKAWTAFFFNSTVNTFSKTLALPVRAVRGGS